MTLPGSEHYSAAGDQDSLVDAIRDFTGVAPRALASGRELRAVLFTDIVDSTKTAFRLGAEKWKSLLERHHALVRAELASFDGAEVDTAGDGFYATFAGPAGAVEWQLRAEWDGGNCAAGSQAAISGTPRRGRWEGWSKKPRPRVTPRIR